MGFISQDELIKIRSSANIVDIISNYIPLISKGKNYFGVCPFHDDHAPSMSVSSEKQVFKCFSCGVGGNAFTFIQDYENISFPEAVKKVAELSGITLTTNIESNINTAFKNEYEIMDTANKFFQNNLKTSSGKLAREYLNDRGFDDAIINEFQIGLSLDDKDALAKLLAKKKYLDADLVKLGLINNNLNGAYDIFYKRITFPIHDEKGKVVAFTGRIYKTDDTSKYINTKETIIFKKGNILYNYHNAVAESRRNKEIIVVEGNMDAIRISSIGVKNVVALMGTSLTKEQISLLKKLRVRVILCLDNDAAGGKATAVNGELLTKSGVETFVIRLSDAKDPDEYIFSKGSDAFKENLKKPIKYFEYRLNYLKENKNLNKSEDLAEYINQILMSLDDTTDDILKELTINRLNKEYGVSTDVLKSKLTKLHKKGNQKTEVVIQNKPKRKNKYEISAEKILYFMINDVKYIRIYKKQLGYFDNKDYRNLANEIQYYYSLNKNVNLADFISYVQEKEEIKLLVMGIIKENSESEINEIVFEDYIKIIKEEIYLNEIKELKKEIKEELDENKKIELLKRLKDIKKEV